MTWADFKAAMVAAGVTDDMLIDIGSQSSVDVIIDSGPQGVSVQVVSS